MFVAVYVRMCIQIYIYIYAVRLYGERSMFHSIYIYVYVPPSETMNDRCYTSAFLSVHMCGGEAIILQNEAEDCV